jgi:hypothetical protein
LPISDHWFSGEKLFRRLFIIPVLTALFIIVIFLRDETIILALIFLVQHLTVLRHLGLWPAPLIIINPQTQKILTFPFPAESSDSSSSSKSSSSNILCSSLTVVTVIFLLVKYSMSLSSSLFSIELNKKLSPFLVIISKSKFRIDIPWSTLWNSALAISSILVFRYKNILTGYR